MKGIVIAKAQKNAIGMGAPVSGQLNHAVGSDVHGNTGTIDVFQGTGGISGANATLSTSSGWMYGKIQATPGPGAYTPMAPSEIQK